MIEKKMGAAAFIMDDYGRVLLVKHSYGLLNWELPGGGAEADEAIHDTTVREAHEETGLHVCAERLTGIYYDAAADFHHFVFICRPADVAQKAQSVSLEIADCAYWPLDSLPRPMTDFTLRRIQDAATGTFLSLPIAVSPRRLLD